MKLITAAGEMRAFSRAARAEGSEVGFVPTMGALHAGHFALVEQAAAACDQVVVSIYVNPAQFNEAEDFQRYPRSLDRDLDLCRQRGVAAVYLPENKEMYPEGYSTWVEEKDLSRPLEGAGRPGHFQGVATVVAKLLHAVEPDVAFFGQKDAQQARVVQRMVRDLQFGCRIEVGPIVREEDGLALSSRNARLADHHRAQAPALFAGLRRAEREFGAGEREAPVLESAVREVIHRDAPDAEVEYVQTSDWETLKPVQGQIRSRALLSLAARFGDVRLIDNVELTP